MSIFIGTVALRQHDDTTVVEVDNGACGKLYLTWPKDGTPIRRQRDQAQLNDLLEALRRTAIRAGLEWPL